MRININGVVRDMTAEELAEFNDMQDRIAAEEAHRPLSEQEVSALFIRAQVNTVDIPDQTSLRMMAYYPQFTEIVGQTVKLGYKFVYGDKLYKTAQDNMTIQAHYAPGAGTESLYTRIDAEHLGNKYDPIPYDGNMELLEGKYYEQSGVLYLCTRATGQPVYHALSELVGLYVTVV